jgi:hypothetical protein
MKKALKIIGVVVGIVLICWIFGFISTYWSGGYVFHVPGDKGLRCKGFELPLINLTATDGGEKNICFGRLETYTY